VASSDGAMSATGNIRRSLPNRTGGLSAHGGASGSEPVPAASASSVAGWLSGPAGYLPCSERAVWDVSEW